MLFIGCENNYNNNLENFDGFIKTDVLFAFTDQEEIDLFEKGVYKKEHLSLIATDENWNDLYDNNGNKIENIRGKSEILLIEEPTETHPTALLLLFGYKYKDLGDNAESFYKLKYDVDKYDYIHVFYNNKKNNFYIEKIIYNNEEFDIRKSAYCRIIKDE